MDWEGLQQGVEGPMCVWAGAMWGRWSLGSSPYLFLLPGWKATPLHAPCSTCSIAPPACCQISSFPHLVPLLSHRQHLDPQRSWVWAKSSLASGRWCVREHRLMTFNCFVCSAGLTAPASCLCSPALRVKGKPKASYSAWELPFLKVQYHLL